MADLSIKTKRNVNHENNLNCWRNLFTLVPPAVTSPHLGIRTRGGTPLLCLGGCGLIHSILFPFSLALWFLCLLVICVPSNDLDFNFKTQSS